MKIRHEIWLCVLCAPAMAAGLCPRPLSVGWDQWPPFHYRTTQGRMAGYAVEVLNAAAQRLGCTLEYRQTPWPRTLQQLQTGQLDIAMQALKTPARERFAWFASGYSPTFIRFWARAERVDRWKVRRLEDIGRLGPLTLGVTRGDSFGPQLDAWLRAPPANVRVEVGGELEGNLRKLQLGRVDLLLASGNAARGILSGLPAKPAVAPLALSWYVGDAYFVFSRGSVPEPLFRAFDGALREMKRDGTLPAIYRRNFAEAYPVD
ncbi:substrate-binding periplasmic protein [Chromobacterium sphagni]|nr:transporter substrate-binding domain-containing protein [Chromobacterium sphagni]